MLEERYGAANEADILYRAALRARNTKQDAQCLCNRAIYYDEDKGDNVNARLFYEAAIKAAPEQGNILGDYAYFLHLQKDNAKSILTFDKAVRYAPHNAHVLCSYAAVLNSNGENIKAKNMYNRARMADSNEQCVRDLAGAFRL